VLEAAFADEGVSLRGLSDDRRGGRRALGVVLARLGWHVGG